MKVKKYTGNNVQEIYQEIRLEMGKDAVILHTKKQKRGGIFGFFAKEYYEITAAVEEIPIEEETVKPAVVTQQVFAQELNQQIRMPQPKEAEEVGTGDCNLSEPASSSGNELRNMQEKMEEMMALLENTSQGFKGDFKRYYDKMIEQEVDSKIAARILKKVEKRYYELEKQESISQLLKEEIFKIIRPGKPIDLTMKNKQLVVALVGPTGVGKTTTIAKLAANYTIMDKKKVSLVTVDTYRIAAVEQLKTVGEIIGVPVEVVFTPQNLKNTINSHLDKDIVFIDTAGRSHKNSIQMSEIKGFLDAAAPDDIFLVLSASTKYKDMLDIIEKYGSLPIKKLVFTKLDETTTYGAILNIVDKTKKSLSYFTNGQSVPDDIEVVDQERFWKLLMGEISHE